MKDRRKTIRMSKEEEKRVLLSLEYRVEFFRLCKKSNQRSSSDCNFWNQRFTHAGCKNWEQSKSADNACS